MNQTISSSKPTENSKSTDTFEPMLKESIDRFLSEYRKGVTDFSNFTSIFSRLLQNLPDPPFGIVWFYSALAFHTSKISAQDSSEEVSVAKDLFQLLVSCSASCNVVEKIAMLAPVICQLYHLAFDMKESKRDIESFLEGVVSYISICCGTGLEEVDGLASSDSCFVDLVRVWVVDKIGKNCEFGDDLRLFFPLVSDEVHRGMRVGCGVGYLAGVVMCEAFLLRLCLKFGSGIRRMELEKEVYDLAVQTIIGFRSYYFFDTLLSMLLEPNFHATTLLGFQDKILLREVLYDSVITVEHSFLKPRRGIQLPGKHLKNLALTWLFVADNAIRSVRENGDQTKAVSYVNAFYQSCLPSQLIKWVTNQIGTGGNASRPHVSTPLALIKWLLIVEDQGIRVFDCDISKIYAKAIICKSREDYELPVTKPDGKKLGENFFLDSDNEGEGEDKVDGDLEMVDSVNNALLSAPGMMKSTATDGTRKRKEGGKDEGEIQVKFVKYHLHENSMREKILRIGNDDNLSSGSDVDNPVSDEDAEYMEH